MSDVVRRTFGVGGAALSALTAGPTAVSGDLTASGDEAVVLLHGIPSSAELFRDAMPPLADQGFDVFAFDLPGYGHTLVPSQADHSLAGAAELLAGWMRTVLNRPVWLVGHDLGGAVAQILATRHPTLLTRLSLADTVFADSWPVPPIARLRKLAAVYPVVGKVRGLVVNAKTRGDLDRGFHDPSRVSPQERNRVFWDRKVSDPDGRRAFARHLKALDTRQTVAITQSLARLPMPTQLLWGTSDVFQTWDEVGRPLQAALPEPDVTLVDEAGHFFPLERPDDFAEALLAWHPFDD